MPRRSSGRCSPVSRLGADVLRDVEPQRALQLLDKLLGVRDHQHLVRWVASQVPGDHLPADDGFAQPGGQDQQCPAVVFQVVDDPLERGGLVGPQFAFGETGAGELVVLEEVE